MLNEPVGPSPVVPASESSARCTSATRSSTSGVPAPASIAREELVNIRDERRELAMQSNTEHSSIMRDARSRRCKSQFLRVRFG